MQRSQQGLDRPPEPRAGRDGVQINARGDQIRAVQCLAWLCPVPSFALSVLRNACHSVALRFGYFGLIWPFLPPSTGEST